MHAVSGGGSLKAPDSVLCHCAFTLAEVLITLGILGVVAALTIPSLINASKNRELQSELNKSYSVIFQALEFMKADIGGDVIPSDYPARQFAKEYKNYFKFIKNTSASGILSGTTDEGDSAESPLKVFNQYKTYSGLSSLKTDFFDDGQILLPDGTLLMIENNGWGGLFITVDINGVNKKPNVWGRDLFTFEITSKGKLLPMGADGTTYRDMNIYCSKISSNRLNGIACTAKAISEADYFKKLY